MKRPMFYLILIMLVIAFGIYHRIRYRINANRLTAQEIHQKAESIAYGMAEKHVRQLLKSENSHLNTTQLNRLTDERMKLAMAEDKLQFLNLTAETEKKLLRENGGVRQNHFYLLGADAYLYYQLTENIMRTGHIGEKFRQNKFFNPLRKAPDGSWENITLHPYLGAAWANFFKLFFKKAALVDLLAWYPIFLAVLSILLFFLFAAVLELNFLAAFAGAAFLSLSPIYLQRSALGSYDNDPYQLIFPLIVLLLLFYPLRRRRFIMASSLLAGFVTVIYAFFWEAWHYLFLVISVSVLIAGLYEIFFNQQRNQKYLQWLSGYFISAVCFSFILLPSHPFLLSLQEKFFLFERVRASGSSLDIRPNTLMFIAELDPASVRKVIYLVGNDLSFVWVVLGFVIMAYTTWCQRSQFRFSEFLFFTAFFLPSAILSLQAVRFSVLLVLPFALFFSFFVHHALEMIKHQWGAKRDWKLPAAVFALLACCVMPPVAYAQYISVVVFNNEQVMNDTWNQVLTDIKKETPKDTIVYSWFDPGYFINAIAERSTMLDGGSQYSHQNYWMAQAFMTANEFLALSIWRMLSTTGNKAEVFLENLGLRAARINQLILNVLSVPKSKLPAEGPPELTKTQYEELIRLTHPEQPVPPGCVFIYDDLIFRNIGLSYLVNWDFDRAAELIRQNKKIGDRRFLKQHLQLVTDNWQYGPERKLLRSTGDELFFEENLAVNLVLKDALLYNEKENLTLRPFSLMYVEEDHLIEKRMKGMGLYSTSVLLLEYPDTYTAVVGFPDLLRSVLYRLYYLKAVDLKFFTPLTEQQTDLPPNKLVAYHINWDRYFQMENQE